MRDDLERRGATPTNAPNAFAALYAAEGSDWFWWFGNDQDSGNDPAFDELFRTHLKTVYRGLGARPPAALATHLVAHRGLWTVTQAVASIQPGDRLTIRTTSPGTVTSWAATTPPTSRTLGAVGGVMGGAPHYEVSLGPVSLADGAVHFRLSCSSTSRASHAQYCSEEERIIPVVVPVRARIEIAADREIE